jgi:hypothetical protein
MNDAYSRGKVIGTSVIAVVLLLLVGLLCWKNDLQPEPWVINLAVALLGVCLGWLIGAIISLYDRYEAKEFSGYVKVISTFLSGYALSKADQFYTTLLNKPELINTTQVIRLLILISSFLVMLLITFYFRRYAFTPAGQGTTR